MINPNQLIVCASCTVLDAPIMDRVMEIPLKSTPITSTSKEVRKESSKVDCTETRVIYVNKS